MKSSLVTTAVRDGRDVVEYQIQKGEMMDGMVLKSCKEGAVPGILPMGAVFENGHNFMYAYTDGKESLCSQLEGAVTEKLILTAFEGIAKTLSALSEQGIDRKYIILDTQYIFMDKDKVMLTCMPGKLADSIEAELPEFFKRILADCIYAEDESGEYVAKLLSAINKGFELEGFLNVLQGLMEEAGIEVAEEPEAVAVEPVAPVEPEPVAVEPVAPVEPEPVAVEPVAPVQPEPVAVEPVTPVQPEPVAVEPVAPVQPEPVAVEPVAPVQPEPVAVEPVAPVQPEPVAVEPVTPVQQEPVAVEPVVPVEPEPVAVEPVTPAQPEPVAVEPVAPVEPEPVAVEPVTPVQPVVGVVPEDDIEFEPIPEELSAKIERMNTQPEPVAVEPVTPVQPVMQPEQVIAPQPMMAQPVPQAAQTVDVNAGPRPLFMPEDVGMQPEQVITPQPAPQPMPQAAQQKPTPHLIRTKNGEYILLPEGEFVMGKSSNGVNYVVMDNNAVSRVHCTIFKNNGAYYVRDENSTNSTYVNGEKLVPGQPRLLLNNCKLHLADEEFTYLLW